MYRDNQIIRLLNYKNLLNQLLKLGFVKVFSDNIADSLDLSASLVRKDFNTFQIKGNQKGGYYIQDILTRIDQILGKSEIQKVILVGVGNLGSALLHFPGFEKENIKIVAGFDLDTSKHSPQALIPILPVDQLSSFVKNEQIKIAIMAVHELAAQQTIELLDKAGIRGILNFTSIKLPGKKGLQINHINIGHELENLIYQVNFFIRQEKLQTHLKQEKVWKE